MIGSCQLSEDRAMLESNLSAKLVSAGGNAGTDYSFVPHYFL
ncbi:hypothetical protein UF75_2478 [Desulfosporosinus sp. I2]|nr:hypothetical protein UF75_2478 [Desulfosporosinus sp. I2]